MARLSVLCTGRIYPPGDTLGTHFFYRLSPPSSAAGKIKSTKNPSDVFGNRTRDFLVCSAVPQTTAPRRTCFISNLRLCVCVCVCLCGVDGYVCLPQLYFGHTSNGFHENYMKITSVRNTKRADSPTVRDNDMANARICRDRTTAVFLALMIDGNRLGK